MNATIKYINWKIDVEELKREINKEYLNCKDNITKIEDKTKEQLMQNKSYIVMLSIVIITNIMLGFAVGFSVFDLFIYLLLLLNIIIRVKNNKLIRINASKLALEAFVNSSIGQSLVSMCNLEDLVKIRVPGELGDRLKSYDIILNYDIEKFNVEEGKLKVVTEYRDISIDMPVYVRDNDECNAITINSTGVFIGSHNRVSLKDTTTKEVNIPISIS